MTPIGVLLGWNDTYRRGDAPTVRIQRRVDASRTMVPSPDTVVRCTHARTDVQPVFRHVLRHVFRHVLRHVLRHVFRHVHACANVQQQTSGCFCAGTSCSMAYIVMAYIVVGCIIMAYIAMAATDWLLLLRWDIVFYTPFQVKK